MNIPELAVRRSVTVFMIVIALVVLGAVSLGRLALDMIPNISVPVAAVMTDYPGASPEEVEKSVTKPLEEVLATLNNVDSITSTSQSGSSTVVLMFDWGTDMDFATLQMREKIDMVRGMLPDGAGAPMVVKMDPAMMPIVQIGVSGGRDLEELTRLVEEEIKPRLERLPGAAWVVVTGGRTREVQVLLDPVKLDSYGISISQVMQALRSENLELTAGKLRSGKKDVIITTTGEFQDLMQLANIPLATSQGGVVYLKDVSEVREGFADMSQETYMNRAPSVGIHVLKQSGANTVQVAERVREELEALKEKLPGNIEVNTVSDQSRFIRDAINTLVVHAVVGSLLAVLILFLFLRSLRSTMVIAVSIPICIIATFTMVYFAGLTLNMVSLGGLALGVGLIVDDSIVVLESIYRYRQRGCSVWESVTAGAQEVAMAVTASTLTNVIVFLPIVFVEGLAAQLFRDLALTVTFSLLASLFVALTVVPVLSRRLVTAVGEVADPRMPYQRLSAALGRWFERMHAAYRELLAWALQHRRRVLAGAAALFVVSMLLVPVIGTEFFPKVDSGQISISIKMPRGTSLEETRRLARRAEAIASGLKEVETTFVSVGSAEGMGGFLASSDTDRATILVKLCPRGERRRSTAEVVEELRKRLALVPGAEIKVNEYDMLSSMMSGSSPITITLRGDDLDVLRQKGEEIAEIVRRVPGTYNVKTSLEEGKPTMEVRLDRQRAAAYGIGTAQVAQALRAAIMGEVVTQYRSGGEECDLRLRLIPEARQDLGDLEKIQILSPTGVSVPLREIAELREGVTPAVIRRQDQARVCTITGDLAGRPLGSVIKDIKARLADLRLPPGYEITYGGQQKMMQESFSSLGFALILGILLVYMVMASQFESLLHPFVIMFTIPLAVIGVVLAFIITGKTFGVTAFIGVILLAGIVVKNGIVLVDYINTLRRRGLSREEAILQAGPVRLRPVLMTALTAMLGMLPLAIGRGEGGELDSPLAVAVIGGLFVATFLTLVVIPVVYTVLEDLAQGLRRRLASAFPGLADAAGAVEEGAGRSQSFEG